MESHRDRCSAWPRSGFSTLVGELPLAGRGGATLYDRIGDLFGWLCLALGLGAVGVSWWRGACFGSEGLRPDPHTDANTAS